MTGKANLAVLGATGVVGRHILEILKELEVPYNTIKFLLFSGINTLSMVNSS